MTSVEITVICNISPRVPENHVALVKMRNVVSYLVSLYTLDAGRIMIEMIIIMCCLIQMALKASWAHRTGENEKKEKRVMIK